MSDTADWLILVLVFHTFGEKAVNMVAIMYLAHWLEFCCTAITDNYLELPDLKVLKIFDAEVMINGGGFLQWSGTA